MNDKAATAAQDSVSILFGRCIKRSDFGPGAAANEGYHSVACIDLLQLQCITDRQADCLQMLRYQQQRRQLLSRMSKSY